MGPKNKENFTVIDTLFAFAWERGVWLNLSDGKTPVGECDREAKFGSIEGRTS